jgi:predicted transcriptional regulator
MQMTSKNRLTVNLSDEETVQFERLAENLKVSKAWLGRRAIIELLDQTQQHDIQPALPLNIPRQRRVK